MTTTIKPIEDVIQDNMMEYSSYVLLDRALPDLRDGLKPVHRRILYTMYLQKATKFTKSANIAGAVMKLHPHGSSYGVMVGMVQKDRQSVPMLEGKGNFAQHTSRDLAPAADRYSEVKLAPVSIDMMKDFSKNLVNFIDNYDGTMKMPEVLPVKFPSVLTYSQSGIGVGFSSSSPSFNIIEVCDAVIDYIELGEKTTLVPDFATGGYIINEPEVFSQINKTGRGTVKIRGKAKIEGNEILITEIPYTTNRETIVEKIVELAREGKLKEVVDIKDLTGLKGMLITVTARRGTDMKLLLEKLYRFTPLQSTFSANMNILVNDLPKVLGTWQIIEEWIKWRRSCIERGLVYDVGQMKEKLHILKGLEKVLLDIDRTIEIIRYNEEKYIIQLLMDAFKIDEIQANEVADMKLRHINKEYIVKKIKDISKLEEQIKSIENIIGNEKELDKIIVEGLQETVQKYGVDRKTDLITVKDAPQVRVVQEVENYKCKVHLTKDGYAYKFKSDQEPFLKPGDKVIKTFVTENKTDILVFGKDTNCYKISVSQIDESRPNQLGNFLPSVLRVDSFEIVNYSIRDNAHKFTIVIFENGRIAKVDLLSAYEGNRRILKQGYNTKQKVVDILTLKEDSKLKVYTDQVTVTVNTAGLELNNRRAATGVYVTRKGAIKKVEMA